MSDHNEVKSDFEPTKSPTEARDRLIHAARSSARATIWTKDQEHIISAKVHLPPQVSDFFFILVPSNENGQGFLEKVLKTPATECFFNLPLAVGQIFFKTHLQSSQLKKLQFAIPQIVFNLQRRKFPRFVIQPGYVLKASFQDPKNPDQRIEKKVFDISAGGLSFFAATTEEGTYPPGGILNELTFKIRLNSIVAEARIAHVKVVPENPENTRLKIGIEFLNIPETDVQKLSSYVLEENSKFIPRFL